MSRQMKKILMAFIGVALSGICVAIFNTALLGADPFTLFVTGIANVFGVGYGSIYTLINAVLLIAVFFLDRHYIGIATIFNLFGVGYIAEGTMYVISQFYTDGSFVIRILMFLFGLLLLCFASSLYYTADLGVSTYDAMALIIAKRTPIPFKFSRIGTDIICVIIGVMCKATIGVGTIITAFFMGPIIQWFITHFSDPLLNGKKA